MELSAFGVLKPHLDAQVCQKPIELGMRPSCLQIINVETDLLLLKASKGR